MLSMAGSLLARGIPRAGVGNVGTTAARGIHTSPSSAGRPVSQVSVWYRQLSNARTKVTRLISQTIHQPIAQAHATISTGAFNVGGQGAARHNVATSIKQSLSFPTRMTLSRPFAPHHLPRPPTVPRCMTQVGLGTARNFSTARPIFQNLVQNVPIAGRAFCEVDWDPKADRAKRAELVVRAKKAKGKQTLKAGPSAKPILETRKENVVVEQETSCTAADLEHYYPEAAMPSITTYLRIPLAPTPTERVPLSSTAADFPLLLPLPSMARIYVTHANHSSRVSALFRKLDEARVWTRGAKMEGWGHPSGLCTVMLIAFAGWTEEMVREVIGEEDSQWVAVQEIENQPPSRAPTASDYGSGMDSLFSSALSSPVVRPVELPAFPPAPTLDIGVPSLHDSVPSSGMEFVMPSIDFSSSFSESHSDRASFAGDWDSDEDVRSSHSDDDFHYYSDDEIQSVSSQGALEDDVQSVATHVTNTNSLGWSTLSFSSDFVHRTAVEQFSAF